MVGRIIHLSIKHQRGFSLIELVIVISLIGIMAISLSNLTKNTVISYIDAKDRNRFSQSSKWAIERISREVREALPQSIRTGSSGSYHCVEFLNIRNASTYLNLPASGSVTSFTAVEFDLSFTPGLIAAIMPINPASIYSGSGTLANVASISNAANQSTINLTSATTFARRSPRRRFFFLTSPIAYCLNDSNGEIRRWSAYSRTASQQFPPSGGSNSLMGENFSPNGTVFNIQPGTLSRASLLQLNFRLQNRSRNLTGDEESFEIFQEVHIRNVP